MLEVENRWRIGLCWVVLAVVAAPGMASEAVSHELFCRGWRGDLATQWAWKADGEVRGYFDALIDVAREQARLPNPFRLSLYAGSVENATAFVCDGLPTLIYSSTLVAGQPADDASAWKIKALLAHELGHLANGHLDRPDAQREKLELDADAFSGELVCLLAGTFEQASGVLTGVDVRPGYPPHAARKAAVAAGWNRARERTGACEVVEPCRLTTLREPLVITAENRDRYAGEPLLVAGAIHFEVDLSVERELVLFAHRISFDSGVTLRGRRLTLMADEVLDGRLVVDGEPGEAGGEIFVVAGKIHRTRFSAKGGDGKVGEHGAPGSNGRDGSSGVDADCREGRPATAGGAGEHGAPGAPGEAGGDGGDGGSVLLVAHEVEGHTIDRQPGRAGPGGTGGPGGVGGRGGRRGAGCSSPYGDLPPAVAGPDGRAGPAGGQGPPGRPGAPGLDHWYRLPRTERLCDLLDAVDRRHRLLLNQLRQEVAGALASTPTPTSTPTPAPSPPSRLPTRDSTLEIPHATNLSDL